MKTIFFIALLLGAKSMAEEEKMIIRCSAPAQIISPATLTLSVTEDSTADFVRVNLIENQTSSLYFSQVEKDQVQAGLTKGELNLILVTSKSTQRNGIVSNAGFFVATKNPSNAYSAFFAAKGNIFSLTCSTP